MRSALAESRVLSSARVVVVDVVRFSNTRTRRHSPCNASLQFLPPLWTLYIAPSTKSSPFSRFTTPRTVSPAKREETRVDAKKRGRLLLPQRAMRGHRPSSGR